MSEKQKPTRKKSYFQPTYTIQTPKDTLFNLSKIKSQLIFFNKDNNFNIFQKIKQQLLTTLNSLSFPIQNIPKKLYLSYYEGTPTDSPEISLTKYLSANETISNESPLSKESNIFLYICIDKIDKREKYISIFHQTVKSIGDKSVVNRSKLILLYEKEVQKENKDGVVYIKINQKILLAEISKTIIELLNEYIKYILNKKPLPPGLKFAQDILWIIKIRTSEYIQIQKYDHALEIINKAIDTFSYENA